MRIVATKVFQRFARKAGLGAAELRRAATDVAGGQHDADLGGGVLKKRIARSGGGKSGGYRTILLLRAGSHVFFAYGFAKSDRANITRGELEGFRRLADVLFALTDPQLDTAVRAGTLIEVTDDDQG